MMLRLPLSLALTLGSLQPFESRLHRLGTRTFVSTFVASRGWVPPEQRYGRKQMPTVRTRPSVNGRKIAFHVNELAASPAKRIVNSYGLHVDIRQRSYGLQNQPQNLNEVQTRQYESDMIVVLDMDECLIHSKFLFDERDAQLYAHQLKQKNQEDIESTGVAVDSFLVKLSNERLVHVHVRPGLFDFLERVCSRYETHIFTAAVDIYADPVLDHLEAKINEQRTSENRLSFTGRWYRQHCRRDEELGLYVKDLNNLWPRIQNQTNRPVNDTSRLSRTVLVDNNPNSFLSNPENGILVNSFYKAADDTELPKVWDLLQELEQEPDVRPALTEKFALRSRFFESLPNAQEAA